MRLGLLALAGGWLMLQAPAQGTPSVLPANRFNFSGNFDCEGAMGNGRVHKAHFTGALVLDGKWIELNEVDIEPATGYQATYLLGYDTAGKQFVEFDANNFGAATYSSQLGWEGGALTMTSPRSPDPKAPYAANRFVYTLSGQDSFSVEWQLSRSADPRWLTSDHLVCKRKSS